MHAWIEIISALLFNSQQDVWRKSGERAQRVSRRHWALWEPSSQIPFSNHELHLVHTKIIALHIKVPPQKLKEVRLPAFPGKEKNIICVLILIATNGFTSAIHSKAEGQDWLLKLTFCGHEGGQKTAVKMNQKIPSLYSSDSLIV